MRAVESLAACCEAVDPRALGPLRTFLSAVGTAWCRPRYSLCLLQRCAWSQCGGSFDLMSCACVNLCGWREGARLGVCVPGSMAHVVVLLFTASVSWSAGSTMTRRLA